MDIGIYWQNTPTANTVSAASILSNFLGGLSGIEAVIAQIWNAVTYKALGNRDSTVFTDSLYALKALKRLGQESGQFLTGSIAYMGA